MKRDTNPPRHTSHRKLIASLLIALGLAASWSVAQQRVNYGHNLDNNMQSYTLRGDMGHKLDNNLRVGGSGYNGSNIAITQGNYQIRRGSTTPGGGGQARHAADLARRQYSPPAYSQAYRDALVRTGRNPNTNPGRVPSGRINPQRIR